MARPRTVFFRDLAPYEASCANVPALKPAIATPFFL